MSQVSYIPVPYFQFIPKAADFDLTQPLFAPVPNKKIHRHCPFTVIDADYINAPLMDVAVATCEDEKPESTSETTQDKPKEVAETEQQPLKKEQLDYLAKQQAKPEHAKAYENQKTESDEVDPPLDNQNQNTFNDHIEVAEEIPEAGSSSSTADSVNPEHTQSEHIPEPEPEPEPTEQKLAMPEEQGLESEDSFVEDDVPAAADSEQYAEESQVEAEEEDSSEEEVEDDEEEELSEDEKQKIKKESQLESYKQFLAEQKSKVKIDYPGIRVDIEANALPSRMYFIMNALSAIIASYGLVVNSAAVVIGAMLVAMMLGPISGAALAIIDYRMPFLRKSLLTVLAGAAMVVVIGFIVGFMHQDSPLTNEILSRTQPTSMDLMIALAGGTAGAYAMISPQLSVAVVGVAVATALVPPLAASGILFAHGEGSLGLGALLLALTNIIAIQFTNALVLWSAGFRRLVEDDYKSSPIIAFFRRNAVPLLLLAVIGTYLTYNFNTITKKQKFENEVKESLNTYFIDKGNTLTTTQFVPRTDYQTVRAVIRGETRPSSDDARYLEQQINQIIEQDYPKYQTVRLQIRYIPVIVIESSPSHNDEIDKTDAAILANEQ